MEHFIKNSKGQMISVSHIRELSIVENEYDEKFEIVGSFGNGDELFLGSYGSEKEAEEVLESIVEVQDISVEGKSVTVLAPEETSEDIPEETEEEVEDYSEFIPDDIYSGDMEEYEGAVEPSYEEALEYFGEAESQTFSDEEVEEAEEPIDVEEPGDEEDEQERGEESEEEDGEQ